VTIPRAEKADPDIPATLTPAQVQRRLLAAESGFTGYYLESLRRAISQGEITFGRFAEMLDMDTDQAHEFSAEIGLAM
jgi:hypothetical protein